ncbi:hypothetical protein [Mycobacterium intracellulare]|uniref:hypothetical protein n=1 Tax=Mycobacterium intracellulare TaxID=1767 RepID=UPI002595D518|nr:hypothetical protein [Mycobacterium intracellulare]MDM3894764.1 hypothetical protein [Mycobacterium intracellulare]
MAARTHAKNTGPTTASADAPDATDTDTQVEAAAEETQPAAAAPADDDGDGKKTIVTKVWAAAGQIPKASVLQTAIQSVRDAIPVVFELEAEITGATKTHKDKDKGTEDGTEFEVTVTYTPRAVNGGKEEPVDVEKVIKGLDVPRSFDGIGGHDGDPDFHERRPTEF